MSKVKTPLEKKRLSLELDRRNTYGESPHAARKNIPRGKATQHQQERKAANQALSAALTVKHEDAFETIEGEIKEKVSIKRLGGFKKVPDAPLGQAIERKQRRRNATSR